MPNSGTKPLCVHCLTGDGKVTAALAGVTRTLAKHLQGWTHTVPVQTVLTGSPGPVPSLQPVSETYSSLNWESVTYLNCFSDLIRIFHLQQAILKYCLYTNSHSE